MPPHQRLDETLAVEDVMIVLDGRLSVSTEPEVLTAGPGEIVHMPKGRTVTIRSHEEGAVTAYVTCPHWRTVDIIVLGEAPEPVIDELASAVAVRQGAAWGQVFIYRIRWNIMSGHPNDFKLAADSRRHHGNYSTFPLD